jgi:predicted nucleotidyltransferase
LSVALAVRCRGGPAGRLQLSWRVRGNIKIMSANVENRLALLESELQRFIEVASEEFPVERIILFGSLARGRESVSEWTDLDLVVVAETDLPFYRRTERLLRKACLRVGADVFVYTPAEWDRLRSERAFIEEEVVGRGRVVYERAG